MGMPARVAILGVICALTASGTAFADTAADTAAKWGLLGTWKMNCNAPTSRYNMSLIYAERDGKLVIERDLGDFHDTIEVLAASTRADGMIELVLRFAWSETWQEVLERVNDRYRTMSMKNIVTGWYSARDGRSFVGLPAPWLFRCVDAVS